MNKTILGMATVALVLAIISFIQGGLSLVGEGLFRGGETLLGVFPILIVAFIVAGFVSILISKKIVSKWLGKEAGWKGPFFGSLMGALVPGGPFFFYPLMATSIASGASVGTMISFVAAKTLWNVARIPVEIAFVGIEITVIRFLITFPIPIIAGAVVNIFFSGFADRIREDVEQLQLKHTSQKRGEQLD